MLQHDDGFQLFEAGQPFADLLQPAVPQGRHALLDGFLLQDVRGGALGDQVATRKAYGNALARLGYLYPRVVSLDAEVKNSSYAEDFKKAHPDRFFLKVVTQAPVAEHFEAR